MRITEPALQDATAVVFGLGLFGYLRMVSAEGMNVEVPVAPAAHRAAQQRLELYAGCDRIEVRRGEGWFAVATGVASNDMNGVVTSTPSALPDRIVDDLFGWFAERALPASWLRPFRTLD